MGMYKCRTCSIDLSETAINCPHCGDIDALYNNAINHLQDKYNKLEKNRRIWIGITVLGIWIGTGFMGNGNNSWLNILWFISPIIVGFIGLFFFSESSDMKSIETDIAGLRDFRKKLIKS